MIFLLFLLWPLTLTAAEDTAWNGHIEAGDALMATGHYTGAQREFLLAMNCLRELPQPGQKLRLTTNRLALVHDVLGEYGEAEQHYRQALDLVDTNLPEGRATAALLQSNLANIYRLQGKNRQAREICGRVILELSRHPALLPYPLAHTLNTHGMNAMESGDLAVAEESLTRAVALAKTDPVGLADLEPQIVHNLGLLYQSQGKRAQALSTLSRALDLMKARLGEGHSDLFAPLYNIASVHAESGNYREALTATESAIRLAEKGLGPEHHVIAEALDRQAGLLRKLKRKNEALPLEARARSIRRNHHEADPARHLVDIKDLARR